MEWFRGGVPLEIVLVRLDGEDLRVGLARAQEELSLGAAVVLSGAGILARVRGILLIIALVIVLLAAGLGIVKLIALPFGGVGTGPAIFFGFLLVVIVIAVLVLIGRRRQARAREARGLPG